MKLYPDTMIHLTDDDTGELVGFIPENVYNRVVGTLEAKLREQNDILAANISVETWEEWKAKATA